MELGGVSRVIIGQFYSIITGIASCYSVKADSVVVLYCLPTTPRNFDRYYFGMFYHKTSKLGVRIGYSVK